MLTLLRGVYLHLLFLPALLSAPLCMGLGVGREAWLLLMRWTLERAGPVRSLCCAPAPWHIWVLAWACVHRRKEVCEGEVAAGQCKYLKCTLGEDDGCSLLGAAPRLLGLRV